MPFFGPVGWALWGCKIGILANIGKAWEREGVRFGKEEEGSKVGPGRVKKFRNCTYGKGRGGAKCGMKSFVTGT